MKLLKNINYKLILEKAIIVSLFVLLIILFAQKIDLNSSDLGRHLENGKVVWQNKDVLFHNFYSYTYLDYKFINHHWLSGVVYYGLYLLGGFKILTLLNIILISLTFFFVFFFTKKRIGLIFSSLISLPVIFLLGERTEVRPEIFSYLFFFLVWIIIYQAEKNKKVLYLLLPLFLLWANLHIYFFLGLLLLGIKAGVTFLEAWFKNKGKRLLVAWQKSRIWFQWLFFSILASLLNPNTIQGLLYPFNILKKYGYDIAENKSIFFLEHLMINPRFLLFKLLLVFSIIIWLAHFILSQRRRWFEFLAFIMILVLALMFSRNISLFALVVLFISGLTLKEISQFVNTILVKNKVEEYIIYSFILLLSIISILFFVINNQNGTNTFLKQNIGLGLRANDGDSFKFFLDHNLQGPIFNDYDIGSAMIFYLYPQEKVFVDNRPEAYPVNFFKEIYIPMQNNEDKWKEFSKKYDINVIYFSHCDSTAWAQTFIAHRLRDPDWSLVYLDQYSLIFLKNNEKNKEIIDRFKINFWRFRYLIREASKKSDISSKLQLADLAVSNNQYDLAEEIYLNVLSRHPNNKRTLLSLGFLYSHSSDLNNVNKAIKYLKLALKNGAKLSSVYNKLGLIYWNRGDYKIAENYWKQCLDIDKKNIEALGYLEQIKEFRKSGKIK